MQERFLQSRLEIVSEQWICFWNFIHPSQVSAGQKRALELSSRLQTVKAPVLISFWPMLREVMSWVRTRVPCLARNCSVFRQDRTSQAALSARATNACTIHWKWKNGLLVVYAYILPAACLVGPRKLNPEIFREDMSPLSQDQHADFENRSVPMKSTNLCMPCRGGMIKGLLAWRSICSFSFAAMLRRRTTSLSFCKSSEILFIGA